jgi:hypothetical protein
VLADFNVCVGIIGASPKRFEDRDRRRANSINLCRSGDLTACVRLIQLGRRRLTVGEVESCPRHRQ